MLCGQKSYAPQAGYSGYEYELSIHLNTSYISFALVRVLRTGAFCFFSTFSSEKRTQEPSPERVRSERGREDKPLTPVLYSTREGGELYGAIFFRQGKNTTSVRRISKEKTLVGEAKSHRRTLAKRAAREVPFSDLSESELAQLFTTDEYKSDYFRFQVSGFDVLVKNELLAEALNALPERKRDIILLSYFLDMSDAEIAELLNVVRTTVFRHRKSALAKNQTVFGGKSR